MPKQALDHQAGGFLHVRGDAMQRTLLCSDCLGFIVAERRDLLDAARNHVLDDLAHHPHGIPQVRDVDTTFALIVGREYGVLAYIGLRR